MHKDSVASLSAWFSLIFTFLLNVMADISWGGRIKLQVDLPLSERGRASVVFCAVHHLGVKLFGSLLSIEGLFAFLLSMH